MKKCRDRDILNSRLNPPQSESTGCGGLLFTFRIRYGIMKQRGDQMEKINYQLETDKAIERICADGRRERLLLHACCAPCSSYVLEYLTKYFDITVFFSNQNITDGAEYKKRLDELYKLCEKAPFCSGVTIAEDDRSPEPFFEAASRRGEQGARNASCSGCRARRNMPAKTASRSLRPR